MQERSLISLFFNPANCVISVIWVTIFWMTLNEGIYHQKYAYNPERCFPPIQMRKLSIIWWHLKGVYTLFCENNFIRTKALILVKKLGTSYEQSQVCCTIEHKNRVSRLAIFKIKKKNIRTELGCRLYCTKNWLLLMCLLQSFMTSICSSISIETGQELLTKVRDNFPKNLISIAFS